MEGGVTGKPSRRDYERASWLADRALLNHDDPWRDIFIADAANELAAARQPRGIIGAVESHLERQRAWSLRTFGPGHRTKSVLAHIRKELAEIEAKPASLEEWIDVAILAFDGAWRAGYSPAEVAATWVGKQMKNEARDWPDWQTQPLDGPIEHIRQQRQITEAMVEAAAEKARADD